MFPHGNTGRKSSAQPSVGRRVGLLVGVLPLLVVPMACRPTNTVVVTQPDGEHRVVPACTAEATAEWQRVVQTMQGIKGFDLIGSHIGGAPAERFGVLSINNWIPLADDKQTLCGKLHHSWIYDGYGDEYDWNVFIIPSPAFGHILSDALPFKGGDGLYCVDDDWPVCEGPDDCVEIEVTPDEELFQNPWIPSSGHGPLSGRDICAYGPWIRECLHGHKPEIHPSELIWWQDAPTNGATTYWMTALQDDSDRFSEHGNYDHDDFNTPGWRAWSAAPMKSSFSLAFVVKSIEAPLIYQIEHFFRHNVITGSVAPPIPIDSDNGADHKLVLNGKTMVHVVEPTDLDGDLAVTFNGLCMRPNGALQGYVGLSTAYGVNNDGKEGFHTLRVTRTSGGLATSPGSAQQLAAVASNAAAPDTLGPANLGGRLQLVGDFQVNLPAEEQGTKAIVESASGVRDLKVQQVSPRQLVVSGLPLLEPGRLTITTSTGQHQSNWPGMSVFPAVAAEAPRAQPAPEAAWPTFVKAAGGAATSTLPLKQVSRVQFSLRPMYTMLKNGKPALEEGSPFVRRLNEVLERSNDAEMARIWGTATPFKVEWTVKVLNLSTGAVTTVVAGARPATGANPDDAYSTQQPAGTLVDGRLDLDLPASGEIFQVTASAKLTDTFGTAATVTRTAWSHRIEGVASAEVDSTLIPLAAELAGVSVQQLTSKPERGNPADVDAPPMSAAARRGAAVANFARYAAKDGQVDLGELRTLVEAAKLLRPGTP